MGGTDKNWNEFRWEQEVRRDERRINRYYAELVSCLDLPNEENIIFDRLKKEPGLVPKGYENNRLYGSYGDGANDNECDDDTPQIYCRAVLVVDDLATEWNFALVNDFAPTAFATGLGIACAYGKLLERVINFSELDDKHDCGLKICLAKRMLADINDLIGRLKDMPTSNDRQDQILKDHVNRLAFTREHVIESIKDLKSASTD